MNVVLLKNYIKRLFCRGVSLFCKKKMVEHEKQEGEVDSLICH